MPKIRGHIIGYGLVICILAVLSIYLFDELILTNILFLGFMAGLIYTLLPDIDHPNSHIRRYASKQFLTLSISSTLLYLYHSPNMIFLHISMVSVFAILLLWKLKHRGLFHNPLIGILFCTPLLIFNPQLAVFGLIGYNTHLLLDKVS